MYFKPNLKPLVKEMCGKVCDVVFEMAGSAAVSYAGCMADFVLVGLACNFAAGGPENPVAHACTASLGSLFTVACVKAITKIGEFGAKQCRRTICRSKQTKSIYNVSNFQFKPYEIKKFEYM